MTEKEKIKKDIELSIDFAKEIVKNPALLDDIPDGAAISFIGIDEPISENNDIEEHVKFVRVKRQFEVVRS